MPAELGRGASASPLRRLPYDLAIVLRNTSAFEKARVTVFNPWVEAAQRETE
jgi:hypothetical protein